MEEGGVGGMQAPGPCDQGAWTGPVLSYTHLFLSASWTLVENFPVSSLFEHTGHIFISHLLQGAHYNLYFTLKFAFRDST